MKGFVATLALVVSLVAPSAARAQSARVVGTLIDPTGAVLPGASVTADRIDPTERTTVTVRTDRVGHFEFSDLRAGNYTLTASLPGFETFRAPMNLDAGDYRERNIQLAIGSLQETITVTTADTPEPPRRAATPQSAPMPPVPPRAPAPGAIAVGGNIKAPMKTADVHPVYPAALAAQGVEGVVVLVATIGGDGYVRDVMIVRSANDEFAQAASNAVSQWQFTPTLLNGQPIDVKMWVNVDFRK